MHAGGSARGLKQPAKIRAGGKIQDQESDKVRHLPRLLFGPGRRVRSASEQRHDTLHRLFTGHRRRIAVRFEPRRKNVAQRSKGQGRHFGGSPAIEEPKRGGESSSAQCWNSCNRRDLPMPASPRLVTACDFRSFNTHA